MCQVIISSSLVGITHAETRLAGMEIRGAATNGRHFPCMRRKHHRGGPIWIRPLQKMGPSE